MARKEGLIGRKVGMTRVFTDDGDAILAAQTRRLAGLGDVVTIATDNSRHLSRFPGVDARPWQTITP